MTKILPRFDLSLISRFAVTLCLALAFSLFLNPTISSAQVRVFNVDDLSLGTWAGSGDLQTSDSLCIYNAGSTDYQITVDGSGGGGAYVLSNGGETLAYQVEFRGGGGWVTLAPGIAQSFTGADSASDECNGLTVATIRITVSESNLLAAHQGNYSGNISILVSP